jgi:hypothetical protein
MSSRSSANVGGPRSPLCMLTCGTRHMATNLSIDPELIERARKSAASGYKSRGHHFLLHHKVHYEGAAAVVSDALRRCLPVQTPTHPRLTPSAGCTRLFSIW